MGKGFQRKMRGKIASYNFEVGILKDGPHYDPLAQQSIFTGGDASKSAAITTYLGGPARKVGRGSGISLGEVSESMREHIGGNYLWDPFLKMDTPVRRMLTDFFKLIQGKSRPKRLENLLQAIVRNPILKGEYGPNSPATQAAKGFDRYGIDTGQWFKAIRARVNRNRRV